MGTIAFIGAVMGASVTLVQERLIHHPELISKSALWLILILFLPAGAVLGVYIQNRWVHGAMRRDELRRDLLAAQQVQQSLLPQTIPQLPNCSIAGTSRMSRDIGGDYFDAITRDSHRIVLFDGGCLR
ncbi:MAG TPA: hypothetical protein VFP59_09190 [Candidatus Angelobacter sp.]|nr:hypothetical protein [Candidatus Angelobacter sp.]